MNQLFYLYIFCLEVLLPKKKILNLPERYKEKAGILYIQEIITANRNRGSSYKIQYASIKN